MYVGHVGVALAARGAHAGDDAAVARRALPLWLLVLAAQGCDWVDAIVEPAMPGKLSSPWSHSIPSVVIASLVFLLAARLAGHDWRAARLVALVYASHWVVDLITGLKPTWPGAPSIGLQLYDVPAIDFALELFVLIIGWRMWLRTIDARRRASPVARALLVALVAVQAAADVALFTTGRG